MRKLVAAPLIKGPLLELVEQQHEIVRVEA